MVSDVTTNPESASLAGGMRCVTVTPPRVMLVVGLVLVVAGFVGLDPWVYENISRALDTKDRPLDRDFYTVTKPLWLFVRYAFAHVVGAAGIFIAVLVLQPDRKRAVIGAAIAVAVTAIVANLAQGVIGRLRPNQAESHLDFVPVFSELLSKQKVSFPSGEAATAFALATALAWLYPRGRAGFYALGALAACARLVNGAHYLSDVVGGAILGTALTLAILSRWRR